MGEALAGVSARTDLHRAAAGCLTVPTLRTLHICPQAETAFAPYGSAAPPTVQAAALCDSAHQFAYHRSEYAAAAAHIGRFFSPALVRRIRWSVVRAVLCTAPCRSEISLHTLREMRRPPEAAGAISFIWRKSPLSPDSWPPRSARLQVRNNGLRPAQDCWRAAEAYRVRRLTDCTHG